jgi:hypothetical protein
MQIFLPILFASLFLNARTSTNLNGPILQIKNANHFLPESFFESNPDFRPSDFYIKRILSMSGYIIYYHKQKPHVFAILDKNTDTVIAYGKFPWRDTHLDFDLFIIGISAYLNPSDLNITNEHIDTFWKAQNLKGCKKCFVSLRYFLTLPYIKYLIYTSKFYYKCLDIAYQIIPDDWCAYTPLSLVVYLLDCCDPRKGQTCSGEAVSSFFLGLFINPLFTYFKHMIIFHIKTLPFHALTLLIELLYLDEKYISVFTHCAFRLAMFFPYSSLFPSILNTIMFLVPSSKNINVETTILPSLEDSFKIEPKNKMFAFPFLIKKKSSCKFYFLILFFEIFYSLLFINGFRKWIPLNNGEYGN